jgi:uncharacterized protein (TIGR03083 family)
MTTLTGAMVGAEQNALAIPRLTHAEAGVLAQTEYERTLAVLESLTAGDWAQPTYCTAWTVRDMTAHLAGAVTGSTTVREFLRQNITNPYVKEAADPVDGINRLQLEERTGRTTAQLVSEFRANGQIAVHNRSKLPWLVRKLRAPMGPALGLTALEYLLDTLYPRDQWMHRYDICAATGKQMVVTPEHDGRITALVLLDIARKRKGLLAQRGVIVQLTGRLDGEFLFGRPDAHDCTLEIDGFDFHLRASGRISVEEAIRRAVIRGDHAAAHWFLSNMEVVY